jgi:hypothetical protein
MLALTFSLLPVTAFAVSEPRDIDGHWAAPAIETLRSYGIMGGDGSGIYAPDRDITRAEFATLVNRAFGYDALDIPEVPGYSDIPSGKWYAGSIKTAIALDYMTGYGGSIAAPEDIITREQAAVILMRVLRLTPTGDTTTRFTDIGEVSSWALDAVLTMEHYGYIVGSGGRFMPQKNLARGEAAALLLNVFGVIVDEDFDANGATYKNVTIRKPGVTFSNAVITGDLFITEGVGDGDVWLDNVEIGGRLLIAGGGENSIHVKDITVGENVVVDKPVVAGEEPVRYRAVQCNDNTVVFQGTAREVIIAEDIIVIIDTGGDKTVFNMFKAEDETETTPSVIINGSAKVGKITAFVPVEIRGGGKVGKVEAHTGGVVINNSVKIEPENIEAAEGVEVTVGNETVTGTGITDPTPNPTPEPTPNPTPNPTPPPDGNNGGGYTPPASYSITVLSGGNGTASASTTSATSGATVTLTATPGSGYQFKEWTVVSGGVTLSDAAANPATFTMPGRAVTVKAEFELIPVLDTPIASAEIHINAPAKGQTPSTTAIGTGNFSIGAVSWNPTDNPFLGGTEYTATVTLTADTGYTFPSSFTATIDGQTADIPGNTGAAVTLSRTFPATLDKEVTGISIKNQPSNLAYTHGNTLNLTGLVVTLTYSDTTTEDVSFADFASKSITATPAHGGSLSHTAHNGQPVAVQYGVGGLGFEQNTNNLTVNKATPETVTFPTAATITYGAALSTSNLNGGTGTGTFEWADGTTVPTVTNSGYDVEFTPDDAANYDYSSVSGWNGGTGKVVRTVSITVTKANPSVSWPTSTGITYGAVLSTSNLTGGAGDGTFEWADSTTVPTVTNSGYQVTFTPNDTANYNPLTQNVVISVTPIPVTIAGVGAANKVYDGTTAATITGTHSIDGNIDDTNLTVVSGDAAFAYKTAGNGTPVTFSGFSLSGTAAGNYILLAQPANVTANITQKPVTVTGFNITKTYDGTNTVGGFGSLSFDGLVGGETATVNTSGVTATYAGTLVGTHSITFTGSTFTMTGGTADPSNYSVTQPTGINGEITLASPGAPDAPTLGSKTANSVTLSAPTGGDSLHSYLALEYGRSDADGGTVNDGTWQNGMEFTGLAPNTTYTFFARYKADATKNNASVASTSLSVTTDAGS